MAGGQDLISSLILWYWWSISLSGVDGKRFPQWLSGQRACTTQNVGNGLIPVLGRSPAERKWQPN